MPNIKIQFQCGCGFISADPTKAVTHVADKKHSLKISGEIKKD